jgi:hypothetical protein
MTNDEIPMTKETPSSKSQPDAEKCDDYESRGTDWDVMLGISLAIGAWSWGFPAMGL